MARPSRPRSPSIWERPRLLAVAVGVPVAETLLLGLTGAAHAYSLAPQATALGPFGVFHDLRWSTVLHTSLGTFIACLVCLASLRATLTVLLVREAWPAGETAPSAERLFPVALAAVVGTGVFLAPWTALLFGVAVVPISWAFFAAVPGAVVTMLLLDHAGVASDWWRRLPPVRAVLWGAASFVGLSLAGMAATAGGVGAAVVAAAGGGILNAAAWRGAIEATLDRRPVRRLVPVTVLTATAFFAFSVGGAGIGFQAVTRSGRAAAAPAGESTGRAVLVVAGFNSDCCSEVDEFPKVAGVTFEQFSYAGCDGTGVPIPHDGSATDADLGDLAARLEAQVRLLAARSGREVAIVAESEGALVTEVFLALNPDAPVDRVMLLSPIEDPGRATYPESGTSGPGVVSGYGLRVVADLVNALAPLTVDPDGPFARSVQRYAEVLAAGPHGTDLDLAVVIPLADAVVGELPDAPSTNLIVVPDFHGGLRGRPAVQGMVVTWARGGLVEGSRGWLTLARVIAAWAVAWQIPQAPPAG